MKQKKIFFVLSLIIAYLALYSCDPVNFMTRAKRIPLLYSINYNYPNVKSISSEINKRAWIVYSDREGNKTKEFPGGSLDYRELKFMEPLIVIGSKGDYYKLIKYNPAVLNDRNQLTNRGEAEYCGWLHKDNLLLFDNAITEVRNGIKLKNLTSIKDSRIILDAEKYFKNDSLLLYSLPELEKSSGTVGLNNIVYVLKFSDKDSKALISTQTQITPKTIESLPIGWVDTALIIPMGQRLVLNRIPKIANESHEINSHKRDSLRTVVSPLSSFYPVLFADHLDNTLVFHSLDSRYIIDKSNNRVSNVNGDMITLKESQIISNNLSNINVIFTFDLTENVISQMSMLSNTVQNIKQVFENSLSEFKYRFAAVLGDRIIPFESDYLNFCDRVMGVIKKIQIVKTPNLALSNAVKLAKKQPNATNLIVYIGEKSNKAEYPSRDIIDGFINYNCRLLSYQVYADNNNIYNNFVLQSIAIIEGYADAIKRLKRKIIVYPDQLRKTNLFNENTKNVYALDFPKRSMTQGMVIFPEKKLTSDPELLISGVDSIVHQIESDNRNLIASMERSFHQVGNHLNYYDSIFAGHFGIKQKTKITSAVTKVFKEVSPMWVSITPRISKPLDSLNIKDFGLLLTEEELKGLTDFFDQISAEKSYNKGYTLNDTKKVRKVSRLRKELRNIPSDSQMNLISSEDNKLLPGEKKYINISAIRKNLKKTYLKELKKCVVQRQTKDLTLAEAHECITTLPTINPLLKNIRIKDLNNKKKVSDVELFLLIECFSKFKKLIEEQKRAVDELNKFSDVKYFIVPKTALP